MVPAALLAAVAHEPTAAGCVLASAARAVNAMTETGVRPNHPETPCRQRHFRLAT